jgi:uncharacterized BrkB/YihY/UPF0761 family membrane protein
MNEKSVSRDANGSSEERLEKGLSLIVIGFLLWFFDALIFFFMPAGVRLGEQRPFAILTLAAFVAGAVVMGFGVYLRKEKQ